MYKYKKEIESLISKVKIEKSDYFKNQKEVKVNENIPIYLQNKIDRINKERNNKHK
tara:strand:+ start:377 stop:544 length:168 start_codon:yes stop_codon:yes gene_type:complete